MSVAVESTCNQQQQQHQRPSSSSAFEQRTRRFAEKFQDLVAPIKRSSSLNTSYDEKYGRGSSSAFFLATTFVHELNEITPIWRDRLYLSGSAPIDEQTLSELGVTAVVCALSENELRRTKLRQLYDGCGDDGPRALYVNLVDADGSDIACHFDAVSEFVDDELKRGGRVLIHCAAGVSRSTTLVIAYLMRAHNFSLRDAYALTKTRRRIVRPNNGFFEKLIRYERSLRPDAEASVKMIPADEEGEERNGDNATRSLVPDVVYEFSEKLYHQIRAGRCYA